MAGEGAFEVLEIRAAGAYGTVCAARRRDDPLGRVVAVKVLRGQLSGSPQVLMRTRDEARLLSKLNHPNIVRVEELRGMRRRPVMIMEWVEGVSIRELLDEQRGPLPPQALLEVGRRSARALGDAYDGRASNGQTLRIVHRDIKPGNLLVSIHGEVKVVDFGLARGEFLEREATTVSTIIGSHGYMAPERFHGAQESPAVDVYGLGLTLIEGMTGRVPVLPRLEASHDEALDKHLEHLETADLSEVDGRALRRLMRSLCAWDPAERPTIDQLIAGIEAFQEQAGLPRDLMDFAAAFVTPVFEGRNTCDPHDHPVWHEVSFLEDPESLDALSADLGSTPAPGLALTADRRVRRFLAEPGWAERRRELKWLLAFNPDWTPEPFVEVLHRANTPRWQFWRKPVSVLELAMALDALKHRPTPVVLELVAQFRDHEDPEIAEAASSLISRAEAGA
ncbi:MAG: protein kinase [Proteobacteria bacterium]|nr:protein kinase [Pseudomonadota bacterium]